MAKWKKELGAAQDAGSARIPARSKTGHKALDRAASAQRKSLASLLSAFADGMIERETLDGELSESRKAFESELTAAKAVPPKSARAAAEAYFDAIDESVADIADKVR